MVCFAGMRCGFYAGNTLKLVEDIGILKPTIFPSVPRLYNKIYGKIKDKLADKTGVGKWLVDKAVAAKLDRLKSGGGVTHAFYDALVFKKMRTLLGGRVRIMLTGSAPISGDVLDFLKICFSSPIAEGYGMTETSAGSCVCFLDDPQTGIVGGPLQNVKLKLRDIPEMGYYSQGTPEDPTPKGEIMFWGPAVMSGYFKNPEKTAESFIDGWLLSGDVGAVMPNGAFKIIDRAKNIFKLAHGEYIAPEKVENVFIKSPYVAQVWIHGESLQATCVCVVVPEEEAIKKWCEDKSVTFEDSVYENQDLKLAIIDDLYDLAQESKLNSLEMPSSVFLCKEPFSEDNNLLTPTFKFKRNIGKKHFAAQIDQMYNSPAIIPTKK